MVSDAGSVYKNKQAKHSSVEATTGTGSATVVSDAGSVNQNAQTNERMRRGRTIALKQVVPERRLAQTLITQCQA